VEVAPDLNLDRRRVRGVELLCGEGCVLREDLKARGATSRGGVSKYGALRTKIEVCPGFEDSVSIRGAQQSLDWIWGDEAESSKGVARLSRGVWSEEP
jgi:hypothetical protein